MLLSEFGRMLSVRAFHFEDSFLLPWLHGCRSALASTSTIISHLVYKNGHRNHSSPLFNISGTYCKQFSVRRSICHSESPDHVDTLKTSYHRLVLCAINQLQLSHIKLFHSTGAGSNKNATGKGGDSKRSGPCSA